MTVTSQVVSSTSFRRWRKRHDWTCDTCGSLTNDAERHAQWHAELTGARVFRNPGMWSEGGHYLTVHVDEHGHPLR